MITIKDLQCPPSLVVAPSLEDHLELSRLVAAAIVNPAFCRLLLVDPKLAIENGYQEETFQLADSERYLLLSIHADSLAGLTQQITQTLGLGLHKQAYSFAPAPDFLRY